MSFSALKKQRGNFAELSKKLSEEKRGGFQRDERYWQLTTDDAGNGYATIRFLPAPEGEEMPYVKMYQHAFKDDRTGKWYIENSRTTIGEPDPVAEANSELWNTGLEKNKDIARKRKRNLRYISNILVVSDPKAPENEGKVFLFRYGAKIFGMIENAIDPKFEDETPFNPFDFWGGANFKLKAHLVEKQRSYDRSGFDAPEELFGGDDDMLEKLWKKQYSLADEVAEDKFKSYDQLKTRFLSVTGAAVPRQDHQQVAEVERQFAAPEREAPKVTRQETKVDDDDGMAMYADLLKDFDE